MTCPIRTTSSRAPTAQRMPAQATRAGARPIRKAATSARPSGVRHHQRAVARSARARTGDDVLEDLRAQEQGQAEKAAGRGHAAARAEKDRPRVGRPRPDEERGRQRVGIEAAGLDGEGGVGGGEDQGGEAAREGARQPAGENEHAEHGRGVGEGHDVAQEGHVSRAQRIEDAEQRAHAREVEEAADGGEDGRRAPRPRASALPASWKRSPTL